MNAVQSVLLAIVGVGLATTLVLPDRRTADIIKAGQGFFQGSLRTAMTGR